MKKYKNRMKKFPEKIKAGNLLREAVRKGIVKKKPCCVCGEKKSEGHHEDYLKPLDVIWLCNKHHREKHDHIFEKGEKHPQSKLTNDLVKKIREEYSGKHGEYTSIARKYSLSISLVRGVIRREKWGHVK